MSRFAAHRVALLMGQDLGYCRRVLSGILAYAEERQRRWIYHDAPADSRVLPLLKEWKPRGIIVHLADPRLARQLLALRVPVVSITQTLDGIPVPTVDVDHRQVGIEAARYLLSLGYRSFGYYGSDMALFSIRRREGFSDTVRAAGFGVSSCHANFLPRSPLTEDWFALSRSATRWIRKLPKPAAILASNDIPARALCHICRLAGFQIPREIAILGVDNDDSECRMSFPSLSSIETPTFEIGRQAARVLSRLIRNPEVPVQNISLPPSMVVARESTELRAGMDERIRSALNHIDRHTGDNLAVPDICQLMKMSRRSAERLFRETLQSSILDQIQAARVRLAKKMLIQTDLPVSEIAARSGFGNPRRLNRAFQSLEKRSPSSLRSAS